MPATAMRQPVTVEIENITRPAEFTSLASAVEALWGSLRALPLGWEQYQAYALFFGEGAVQRVESFLERDGQLTLSFGLAGTSHALHIRPSAPASRTR